jgi:hypothetical protein
MRSQVDKAKQYWFIFFIIIAVIFAVSWYFGSDKILNSLLGNEQDLILEDVTPAGKPTDTPTPEGTSIEGVINPSTTQAGSATQAHLNLATDSASAFTPETTITTDCTYTIHFWKVYPGAWEIDRITFGERAYTTVQAIAILNIDDPSLATTRLMQQYITALLNISKGADPIEVERTMTRALNWLTLHPPEIGLTQAESLEADILARELENYNNGITGPGHCLNEPFTPTPGITPTPLNYTPPATATRTPGPTSNVPLLTPTATKKPSGGGGEKPKPTSPPPTAPPPTEPPPPPPTKPRPTPSPAPPATPEP